MASRAEWLDRFASAIDAHDATLAERGLDIWVGGEPTFTDRWSADPQWNGGALGDDKRARAVGVLRRLAERRPGAAVLRALGRQYPDEDLPRWSLGVYARRDGTAVWRGPPDPCLLPPELDSRCAPDALVTLRDVLLERLAALGLSTASFELGESDLRVLYSPEPIDGITLASHPDIARASAHDEATPPEGPIDALAARSLFLIVLGQHDDGTARIELPQLFAVDPFVQLLELVGDAASHVGLAALVLGGFAPPTDASVAWTTVTPDPGVLELNLCPCESSRALLDETRAAYQAAEAEGLSAWRLHFNGHVTESGGGGHLTLGGRTPETSPFFVEPQLLPRLICYFSAHPSLSYAFCEQAGSSSQAPRADEGAAESVRELELALHLLEREPAPDPELIWRTLAPFLVDRFGNTHRAEINVEKLCNPLLPLRGKLGLVELRAMRMPERPERWAALAALLRAVVARLGAGAATTQLTDWGRQLHDRFALPFYLRQDLRRVFADLDQHGLLPAAPVTEELLDDDHRVLGVQRFGTAQLVVRQAIEFWPVIGDLSAQNGTSRLLDASCRRVELCLRAVDEADEALEGWTLSVDGYDVPLVRDDDEEGAALVIGLRYRAYTPAIGLHPSLPAHGPLTLALQHPDQGAYCVRLHDWRPQGGAYEGLPVDQDDAMRRRQERLVLEEVAAPATVREGAPAAALTRYCFDTRWLPVR
ncbi:MAG: transglutaminase family protein [Myxococcales bacterium]|nr:transglutaminase family protein [Myxococcales bacterium]